MLEWSSDASSAFNLVLSKRALTTSSAAKQSLKCAFQQLCPTNGKVCIATRIYDDYGAIEDSIYMYLYKKMGITKA